jgi:hypothetical protein
MIKSLILIISALFSLVQQIPAQSSRDPNNNLVQEEEVLFQPLHLYVSGEGKIYPFKDGKLIRVGRTCVLFEIPKRGWKFQNWQPVNVFTTITTISYGGGGASYMTNTISTPQIEYINTSAVGFIMEPETVLEETPLLKVTLSKGWQANFVPLNAGQVQ